MDWNSLITAGASSGMIAVMYSIYKIFKHSRCRSKCCDKTVELSVDLESGRNISLLNSNGASNKDDSFRISYRGQAHQEN